jgi:predicted nucleic acid-binding protein
MTDRLVLDSSALVALLADRGPTGEWVASLSRNAFLTGPSLVMFETANVLRRHQLAGRLEPAEASMAHRDLVSMPLQLWPYEPLADRVWELRDTVTAYDASYVAVAERVDADLVTLDRRLAQASGPRCRIRTPPRTT